MLRQIRCKIRDAGWQIANCLETFRRNVSGLSRMWVGNRKAPKCEFLQGYQQRLQASTRLYKGLQGYLTNFEKCVPNVDSLGSQSVARRRSTGTSLREKSAGSPLLGVARLSGRNAQVAWRRAARWGHRALPIKQSGRRLGTPYDAY
jgi:hypothetical protein